MTKLINNHVLFSFDDPYTLHNAAKVYRYLDTLRVMKNLAYVPFMCVGYYKGQQEPAIMMDYNDYMEHVDGMWFMESQESVLVLNPRNPRVSTLQGTLVYFSGEKVGIGDWRQITPVEVMNAEGWTYMHGKYFTCD